MELQEEGIEIREKALYDHNTSTAHIHCELARLHRRIIEPVTHTLWHIPRRGE